MQSTEFLAQIDKHLETFERKLSCVDDTILITTVPSQAFFIAKALNEMQELKQLHLCYIKRFELNGKQHLSCFMITMAKNKLLHITCSSHDSREIDNLIENFSTMRTNAASYLPFHTKGVE